MNREPIAIIGLGCRFPGAPNPRAFWQLLAGGVDAITTVPPERWDIAAFYDPDPAAAGKMSTRWGGFIDHVDAFDPLFFKIAPREVVSMDPQQRLLLEVTWEALEDAGLIPEQLAGSQTGVFIGISSYDYCTLLCRDTRNVDAHIGTGNTNCIAANRISYLFDFRGPSLAIDTACSSSLVAVHLGCKSLWAGESSIVIAGGVQLVLSPWVTVGYSKSGFMSPDGRCKAFDAAANGYVRSEGSGIVVLKPLSRALRDGDPIYALIRGSAINQDGRSNGLTAPNPAAQEAVLREAYREAEVAPAAVQYVEAHGTGTKLGDPIEMKSLAAVVGAGRSPANPCAVGSVKTNIGHLEAAAGIAGLIKVALSLRHHQIPPSLHFKNPNPYISFDKIPLRVQQALGPWPEGQGPALAGVSSFGFGGTNAHMVLEGPPVPRPGESGRARNGTASEPRRERPLHLLTLRARSENSLRELARRHQEFLTRPPGATSDPAWDPVDLGDVCYSANIGRSNFPHRLAVVAGSTAELGARLAAFAERQTPLGAGVASAEVTRRKPPKVAFLFTGQGAQYPGMGRQLYETQPTFRAALDRCAQILDGRLERPLLSVLDPPPGQSSPIDETAYTQPALFALEYALAELWRSWGVQPAAVLGHSVGEFAAACVAGVFSVEDGLRLVAERARLMQALPRDGAMAAVLASEDEVAAVLARHGTALSLGAVNGPRSVVLSGRRDALQAAVTALEAAGVKVQPLRVSHAFHSALMEPMLDDLARAAGAIAAQAPRIPLVSNVTGAAWPAGEVPDAAYWRRHTRAPVRFMAGIQALHAQGCEFMLEVGPKPVLVQLGRQCLPEAEVQWLPSLVEHKDDWPVLLGSLSALYLGGVEVDWKGFDQDYPRQRLSLPNYPFDRKRYWFQEEAPARGDSMAELAAVAGAQAAIAVPLALGGSEPEMPRSEARPPDQNDKSDRATGGTVSESHPSVTSSSARREAIVGALRTMVADLLRAAPSEINPQVAFLEMGADSITLIEAVRLIETQYQQKVTVRQLFEELTTIEALAGHIDRHLPPEPAASPPSPSPSPAQVKPASVTPTSVTPAGTPAPALAAPIPVPAAMQPPRSSPAACALPAAPTPSVPLGLAAPQIAGTSALERIFSQQLQIITLQLDVLRGHGAELAAPTGPNGLGLGPHVSAPPPNVAPAATVATPSYAVMPAPSAPATSAPSPAAPVPPPVLPSNPAAMPASPSAPGTGGTELSPRQERHLQALIERYTRRTQGSKAWAQKYRSPLADSRALAGFRMPIKEMSYPIVGSRYHGARIWDIDGNEYVDIAMGFGVHLFGHGAPFIEQALRKQLERGFGIGPQAELGGQLAALFTELTGAERVAFCQSGSEAVMTSLRLARTATRREKIALFKGSFHGHFDGVLAQGQGFDQPALPVAPGVSAGAVRDVVVLDYGEPSALEYFRQHVHELAAVLVEPVQSRRPDLQPRTFLHELRALTEAAGTALIFDEIVTGFRIHPGGAQAHFGVRADLATYGKIPGGGLPLAAVAGTRRFMDGIDGGAWNYGDLSYPQNERTFFAGTFNKPPLSLATGLAVFEHLKAQGPRLQERLNQRTAQLVATLNADFEADDVPVRVVHFGSLFRFVLKGNLDIFFHHLIDHGVYVWEGRTCFLSTAHTEADVEHIIRAVRRSVDELREGGFIPERPRSAPAPAPQKLERGPEPPKAPEPPKPPEQRTEFWERRRLKAVPAEHGPRSEASQPRARWQRPREAFDFSLYYFGKYEAAYRADKYDLLIEGARFADQHGFSGIWVPERHFHPFGGFSPNPSVVCAALARETERLQLRAGSVVVPLHHPMRIAEEWAVVDNLSRGRVGLSFASGWHPDDFVFAPEAYGKHRDLMFEGIETIRKLWRGETLRTRAGGKNEIEVGCFPLPVQRDLPTWITIVNNPDTYVRAGEIGAGVLTNLMGQTLEDLAGNIDRYRESLVRNGRDPASGHVTVLLHTFVGADLEATRAKARQPFCDYLDSHFTLFQNVARSQNLPVDVSKLSPEDRQYMLAMAYERYVRTSALIGSPESCIPIIDTLRDIGVDEIACFVDFGVDARSVLDSLPILSELKDRYRSTGGGGTGKVAPRQAEPLTVPLTVSQQEFLIVAQMTADESSQGGHQAVAIDLTGPLRLDALRTALTDIVNRHEALRTTISAEGDRQLIHPAGGLQVEAPLVDLSHVPEGEREQAALRWLDEHSEEGFDLNRGPLFRAHVLRLGEQRHVLSLVTHHIFCDGQSMAVIIEDFGAFYAAACRGVPCTLRPPLQFREYIERQNQEMQSEAMAVHEAYWLHRFAGPLPVLELPTDRPRPPIKTFHARRHTERLGSELYLGLKKVSQQQGATLFMTLFAAYVTLLHRMTSQTDIIVGVPSSGRTGPQSGENAASMVGHCANLLPIRTDVRGDLSFAAHLARVKSVLLDGYEHQAYRFATLLDKLHIPRDPSVSPLVTVAFNLDRLVPAPPMPDLEARWFPRPIRFAVAELGLSIVETPGGLVLDWDYNTDLFDTATVERTSGHFRRLLEGLVARPGQPLAELPFLSPAEAHQILVEWNQTSAPDLGRACVHDLVATQIERTPDAVALCFGEQRLTYRDLGRRVTDLASHLRANGAGRGALVGLCVERSAEMVIGLLGILHAGAAYVPLDPSYPRERLAYMLEDARLSLLVVEERTLGALPETGVPIVRLDAALPAVPPPVPESPAARPHTEDLAYVMYTSGSTGQPKGIEVRHGAVSNLLQSVQRLVGVNECDTLLAVTTISFDIAALELYLPLITGARLAIADRETAADGQRLQEELARTGATLMQATPATWQILLEAGWPGDPRLGILCGGEALPHTLAAQLLTRGRSLWNLYGPTETTIWSSAHRVTPRDPQAAGLQSAEPDDSAEPIGRPLANTQLRVLDPQLQPVPVGALGELYIGGDGLARGYRGLPAKTAERFLPDPFSGRPGARLYRTGDLARYLPDGTVEYVGRTDHQIKIRGFRVELGAIEAALSQHPAIAQVAVIARDLQPGDKQLSAYLVTHGGSAVSPEELRSFLKDRLPSYMTPATFVSLDKVPLTPSGKVDRKALAAIDVGRSSGATYVAPRNPLEAELVQLWEDVLGTKPIGVQDNFFHLGGNSLLGVRLLARIRRSLGQDAPLSVLIEDPTVAHLAQFIYQQSLWSQAAQGGRSPAGATAHGSAQGPSRSPLIKIRTGGGHRPLFFAAQLAGIFPANIVVGILDMAQGLDPEQPLYGLQAPALAPELIEAGTRGGALCLDQWEYDRGHLDRIAQDCVRAIQDIQPEGPYYLGGFCSGGLLALEISDRLIAAGQEVAHLVLLDLPIGGPALPPEPLRRDPDISALVWFVGRDVGWEAGWELADLYREFEALPVEARWALALDKLKSAGAIPASTELPDLRRLFDAKRNDEAVMGRLLDRYEPPICTRPVTLFISDQTREDYSDEALRRALERIRQYLTGSLDIHFVPGDHASLFHPPHVEVLTAHMNRCLAMSRHPQQATRIAGRVAG